MHVHSDANASSGTTQPKTAATRTHSFTHKDANSQTNERTNKQANKHEGPLPASSGRAGSVHQDAAIRRVQPFLLSKPRTEVTTARAGEH